jgi:hypothetical protein
MNGETNKINISIRENPDTLAKPSDKNLDFQILKN